MLVVAAAQVGKTGKGLARLFHPVRDAFECCRLHHTQHCSHQKQRKTLLFRRIRFRRQGALERLRRECASTEVREQEVARMPGLFATRPSLSVRPERKCGINAAPDGNKDRSSAFAKVKVASSKVCPVPIVEEGGAAALDVLDTSSHGKTKQVSEPLGASIRARICDSALLDCNVRHFETGLGCSSGSEHESLSLAAMVHNWSFMEDQQMKQGCGRARCNCATSSESVCSDECEGDDTYTFRELAKFLQGLAKFASGLESAVSMDVMEALRMAKDSQPTGLCNMAAHDCSGSCLRRAVMARLRCLGYNAAICKSRWDHSRGFPGGDYEYIDIIADHIGRERLIVDVDFRGQFQIARPTQLFSAALKLVPAVFVGKADRLQQLVDLMSDATKWSLKSCGMHLPPWRKTDYMRAKWLAAYKRTTNEVPLHAQGGGAHNRGQLQASPPASSKAVNGTTPSTSAAVVSVKRGSGTQDDPIILEMEIGNDVDAVIYKGKVFPASKFLRPVVAGLPPIARLPNEVSEEGKMKAVVSKISSLKLSSKAGNSEWQLPQVIPGVSKAGLCMKAGLAALLKGGNS